MITADNDNNTNDSNTSNSSNNDSNLTLNSLLSAVISSFCNLISMIVLVILNSQMKNYFDLFRFKIKINVTNISVNDSHSNNINNDQTLQNESKQQRQQQQQSDNDNDNDNENEREIKRDNIDHNFVLQVLKVDKSTRLASDSLDIHNKLGVKLKKMNKKKQTIDSIADINSNDNDNKIKENMHDIRRYTGYRKKLQKQLCLKIFECATLEIIISNVTINDNGLMTIECLKIIDKQNYQSNDKTLQLINDCIKLKQNEMNQVIYDVFHINQSKFIIQNINILKQS